MIDKQHEDLFDLANQIVDPNNDLQKTHQNVLALYYYVREHFKDEEALMKQCKYPDYKEHIKEHALLTKRLAEVSSSIITGEIKPAEIMKFMRNWLLGHVVGKDVLIADFVHQINHKQNPLESEHP